jgi:hypothetical protein
MPAIRKEPSEKERKRRSWLFWLLLIPLLCLTPICLWLTSQAAGIGLVKGSIPENIGSGLFANYGTWEPGQFNPVNPELIGTIRADQATAVAGPGLIDIIPFVPIIDLPGLTQIAAVASPTPAPTATPVPTNTPRPLPTATAVSSATPVASLTPLPTSTNAPPPPPPPPIVPAVQFSAASYAVMENAVTGLATITVTLSAATTATVTVNYATSAGSAVAGTDYTDTSGTLTFAPGVTSQTFSVALIDNALVDGNRTVTLTLSSPGNGTLGAPNPATLTIVDDESLSSLNFSSSTYSVTEANTTVTVTVNLSSAFAVPVTVNYATNQLSASGTAPDQDYTPTSGTLIFPAGSTSQTFTVTILDDTILEPTEQIGLALSSPVNATLGAPSTATIDITDNETSASATLCKNSGGIGIGTAGINIGARDGTLGGVPCGTAFILNVGAAGKFLTTGDNTNLYELVVYEQISGTGTITADTLIVQIGATASGPWYTVYNWGDGCSSTSYDPFTVMYAVLNASPPVCGAGWPSIESDQNKTFPSSELLASGGTGIDIDQPGIPAGSYGFIRLISPAATDVDGGSDMDAVDVIP